MALADRANQYIDEKKPWVLAKNSQAAAEVVGVCTLGLNLFRALMIYLKPVLPALTERAEKLLAAGELRWSDVTAPLLGRKIARFEPLLQRIELATLEKIAAETRALIEGTTTTMPASDTPNPPMAPAAEIDIAQFQTTDLRVARVIDASLVEGADKLLQAHARRRRPAANGVRRHPEHVRAQGARRPARDPRCELEAPQDALRRVARAWCSRRAATRAALSSLSPDSGATPGMKVS